MFPILDRYGPFFLYSFTIVLGLGLVIGIVLTARQTRTVSRPGWMDALLVSLVFALIGGRLGFVWANGEYFRENPAEAWLVTQGGLSYHGALFTGVATLAGWCRRQRQSFAQYADLFAPALALVSAFGWLACWLEGCAYGRETTIGLLADDLPDSFGVYAVRYQTQLVGLLFSLLVFILVWRWRWRLRPGLLFWLTIGLLSTGRVIVSLFLGSSTPAIGQVRLDTIIDAAFALISMASSIYELRTK